MAKLIKYDENGEETISDTSKEENPSKDIPTIFEINRDGEEQELFGDLYLKYVEKSVELKKKYKS